MYEWSELLRGHVLDLRIALLQSSRKQWPAIAARAGLHPRTLADFARDCPRTRNVGVRNLMRVADAMEAAGIEITRHVRSPTQKKGKAHLLPISMPLKEELLEEELLEEELLEEELLEEEPPVPTRLAQKRRLSG